MRKIPVSDLQEGMIPAQTIYDSKGTILIARGISLTQSYINRLSKFSIREVLITSDEEENQFASIFSPTAEKAASYAQNLISELSTHRTVNIEKTGFKIEQVIYAALERAPLQPYLETMSQNELLYAHSLRTTILSVNLGLAKGYDYLNLDFLATCALLHDCGMGDIFCEDDNIHAFEGFIKIRNNTNLDMLTALVCLQHHERFDGQGAPLGFSKYQITEFSRLITVADYYERLISLHNNTPRQAVFKLAAGSGTMFDPDMVKLFETTLAG